MRKVLLITVLLWSLDASANDTVRLNYLMGLLTNESIHKLDSFNAYAVEALSLAQKTKSPQKQTRILRMMGLKAYISGHHDTALSHYMQAIKIAEKQEPFTEFAVLLYDCAGLYSKNGNTKKAEEFIRWGMSVAEDIPDIETRADGFNRLGPVKEKQGKLDSAIICYDSALALNLKINNLLSASYSLEFLGGAYGQLKQPKKSLEYMKRSLRMREQLGDEFALSMSYINIAESFNLLHQTDSAIFYANRAIQLGRKIQFLDMVKYAYQFLSEIHSSNGRYAEALAYYKQYSQLHDSIFNQTKSKQVAELTTKYETEKKEEQIKLQQMELRQKNMYLLLAAVLFLLGIVAVVAIYRHRKARQDARFQRRLFEQQQEVAKAVLDAEERERRRIAADLHDGVGQTLSAALLNLNSVSEILQDSEAKLRAETAVQLVKDSYTEMRTISHQMMPNALLKAGLATAVREFLQKIDESTLKVSLETIGLNQQRLHQQTETILYRIIQETVTNVVKHANASKLYIQIVQDEEGISLAIEDNGKGFQPGSVNEGIGLSSIRNRVQILNGTVDFDSSPGKGTLVSIFIPATAEA